LGQGRFPAKSIATPPAQTRVCGECGTSGHNRRGCATTKLGIIVQSFARARASNIKALERERDAVRTRLCYHRAALSAFLKSDS
jgi:hypothetical protein